MRAWLSGFIFFIFSAGFMAAASADSLTVTAQRAAFLQAKSALNHGNQFSYKLLGNPLRGYILYPYLEYAALTQQLTLASAPAVERFLKTYRDTPLNERLRTQWLFLLAKKQRWQAFLNDYQPGISNTDLQCYYAEALWQTQRKAQADAELAKIWLSKNPFTPTCLPILKAWHAAGLLTADLAWQRVRLSVKANQLMDDDTLLSFLSPILRLKARFWVAVRKTPEMVLNPNLFVMMDDYTDEILIDGIQHLAILKPREVAAMWPKLREEYDFSPEDEQLIQRAIAIELARIADPQAIDWLAKIKPAYVNDITAAWRIRTVLGMQNWLLVKYYIQQLPPATRLQPVWQYWYARALAETGHLANAQAIYSRLADQVDYYGLMASQQLKIRYQPAQTSFLNNQALIDKVIAIPAVQRARELNAVHMPIDSRREWQWALKQMDSLELHAAAQLAMQWNWYDRALITAAKAKDFTNIKARFPLAYYQEVSLAAAEHDLDPAWILAIMRQESGFISDARSSVGALGLMQLMPGTARMLDSRIVENDLLDSNINISLGSHYLKQLYDDYDRNIIIATAAYNVGPARLQKWLPLYKKLPTDIWVEILPWQETRNYVQTVSLAMAIYHNRLR